MSNKKNSIYVILKKYCLKFNWVKRAEVYDEYQK